MLPPAAAWLVRAFGTSMVATGAPLGAQPAPSQRSTWYFAAWGTGVQARFTAPPAPCATSPVGASSRSTVGNGVAWTVPDGAEVPEALTDATA